MAPETENPVPLAVAALMVNADVPVELKVTVCVTAVLTLSLPKLRLLALTPRVGVAAPSCSAKVLLALPALAVSVTVCALLTAVTVAEKVALEEPEATVTDAGTVTAELLLARFTAKLPLAAAAFSVTEQLSVPAPVIDPLVQLSPLSTGTPVPPRLIAVEAPVEELLLKVSVPVAAPAAVGSNCTVNVTV